MSRGATIALASARRRRCERTACIATWIPQKFQLNYSFLSDPEGQVAGAFGFKPRERKTALIALDGTIQKVYEKVDTKTHALDVLREIDGS